MALIHWYFYIGFFFGAHFIYICGDGAGVYVCVCVSYIMHNIIYMIYNGNKEKCFFCATHI